MTCPLLSLTRGDVTVSLAPERGALVTSLVVSGTELFYLDRATLDDPAQNVRGGVPLLFPFAGKLADGRFLAAGTTMKQHGFGRDRPWPPVEQVADHVRLRLAQDDDTRARFPFAYEADYTVTALERGVELRLRVESTGRSSVPLSPGWHPYFRCAAAAKASVTGNVDGFTRDKLGDAAEFDFGLLPPASGETVFEVPGLGNVQIRFSPIMRHMQFWSQPGKDFICLEPFFGPSGTINGDQRLEVPAGESRELWVRIELGESAPPRAPRS